VGKRNYRRFIVFVGLLFALCSLILGTLVDSFVGKSKELGFGEASSRNSGHIGLFIYVIMVSEF